MAHLSAYLQVSRTTCKLTLYKRAPKMVTFKPVKTYRVAVGSEEYPTPNGMYLINSKVHDPAWKKPNSDWVPEEERGQIIPGGDPANPLKARWMGIINGVGIHGTDNLDSLGTWASHGCIRMSVPDVKELYDLVPLWSLIRILGGK